jgi:hypothetical protein
MGVDIVGNCKVIAMNTSLRKEEQEEIRKVMERKRGMK